MKIAVLTLPLHTNYGGILQCYALCSVLRNMGHEVKVIDQSTMYTLPLYRILLTVLKRLCLNIVKKDKASTLQLLKLYTQRNKIAKNMRGFCHQQIPMTKESYTGRKLRRLQNKGFDAYIVGADQVWRPLYAGDIKQYFFDFLHDKKTKRISYAASFGVDYQEYSIPAASICGRLLEQFDAVSVREKSAIKLIESIYGWKCKEPQLVLDPTLLLSANDYINTLHLQRKFKTAFINMYVLDDNQYAIPLGNYLSINFNLDIYQSPSPDIFFENEIHECDALPSPTEWLTRILYADWVLTDSFHGCVFSILFHRPFIVLGNPERGLSRINNLLEMFGLENRLVISNDDFMRRKDQLLAAIDYQSVDNILKEKRIKSVSFLVEALS